MGDEIERGIAEELELLRDEGMCFPCLIPAMGTASQKLGGLSV